MIFHSYVNVYQRVPEVSSERQDGPPGMLPAVEIARTPAPDSTKIEALDPYVRLDLAGR